MKKTYIIYESYYGSRHIEFDTKEEAEKYCRLLNANINQYFVRENVKYDNLQDFINNNTKEYIEFLEKAIEGLKRQIKAFPNSDTKYYVTIVKGKNAWENIDYCTRFSRLKEIVEDGPENCNFSFGTDERDENGYITNQEVTLKDYPKFVEVYNNALKTLEDMKKDLEDYKKQLKIMKMKQIFEKQKEETLENE